ncbi:MAG TPA: hypothetical protein VJ810_33990 [Blastocatellia bacterium]|nr:hypothetical protein [Blastocatellia bacterium]
MSKSKANRGHSQSRAQGKRQPQSAANDATAVARNVDRRKFLTLGLGGAGALAAAGVAGYGYKAGWFDSAPPAPATAASPVANLATGRPLPPVTLPADYQNALRAADEIVRHYSRELNSPTTVIHAVRAFGKNFTLNDGSKAIDFLCERFAADREINGKRYVYFPREHETHDNSILKTMLEAGVSPDQPIKAGASKYTLRDLGESAKALFRCDPQNLARYDAGLIYQHLPWGLIAFSILVPPSKADWTNAYGETINLPETINSGLAVFESTCAGVGETVARGEDEPLEFRKGIVKYSCDGMHLVYAFFSCLNHGYTNNNLQDRLNKLLDSVLYRLKGDVLATDREAAESTRNVSPDQLRRIAAKEEGGRIVSKGPPPPNWIEMERLRTQIRMLGHAMEAINYGRLHKLFKLTADQQSRLRAGEQSLYEHLVKMRAIDLDPFLRWYPKSVANVVIAVAHASRALKLLTPDNPDTMAG